MIPELWGWHWLKCRINFCRNPRILDGPSPFHSTISCPGWPRCGSSSLINPHGLSCAQTLRTVLSYFVPPTSIGKVCGFPSMDSHQWIPIMWIPINGFPSRGFPSHGINTGDISNTKGVLAEAWERVNFRSSRCTTKKNTSSACRFTAQTLQIHGLLKGGREIALI